MLLIYYYCSHNFLIHAYVHIFLHCHDCEHEIYFFHYGHDYPLYDYVHENDYARVHGHDHVHDHDHDDRETHLLYDNVHLLNEECSSKLN